MKNKWLDALPSKVADDVLAMLFEGDKLGAIKRLRREVDLITAKTIIDNIVGAEPWLLKA